MSTANNNNGYNNKRSASDGGNKNADADADGGESEESFVNKMKRLIINFGHNTKLCCFKVSKQKKNCFVLTFLTEFAMVLKSIFNTSNRPLLEF